MSAARSSGTSLADIAEAIKRIREVVDHSSMNEFEQSWEKRWLVERGLSIVSEASRRLSADIKTRHPDIPWTKIAGIGNVLRHDYHRVAADVLWKVVRQDLSNLEPVIHSELARTAKH